MPNMGALTSCRWCQAEGPRGGLLRRRGAIQWVAEGNTSSDGRPRLVYAPGHVIMAWSVCDVRGCSLELGVEELTAYHRRSLSDLAARHPPDSP